MRAAVRVVFWVAVAAAAGVVIGVAGWVGQNNRCAWLAEHEPGSDGYGYYCTQGDQR